MHFFDFCLMRTRSHCLLGAVMFVCGCGTMKNHVATEQLLISDAIERAVDQLDFSPLANATVYLDTQYMSKVTAQGFLNSDYIRSALRERLMAAKCKIKDRVKDAEYVVEVRVGALGTDAHEINYGIPASQPIAVTASLIAGNGAIPSLPEVSLAKKDERRGAAKLYVFAYNRETLEPVWHPDVAHGRSTARSMWVFGAGPFEKGTIYDKTRFAGAPLDALELQSLGVDNLSTLALSPSRKTATAERPHDVPSTEPGLLTQLLLPADTNQPPASEPDKDPEKAKLEKVMLDRVEQLGDPSVAADEGASNGNKDNNGREDSGTVKKATVEFRADKNSQP